MMQEIGEKSTVRWLHPTDITSNRAGTRTEVAISERVKAATPIKRLGTVDDRRQLITP